MILSRNDKPLPAGSPLIVDETEYPWAALVSSEDLRAELGIVVLPDPEPEPIRPELPKSTVVERVIDLGKINAVDALLKANPIFNAQWFMPGWPNVFCDDPGLIIALNAVGCTEAEILAITAP